ncbi:hypothetical protein HPB48_007276 [Haemaphysalis longicornis]|uniref:Reverse transcriptase domain-containing protein n=1 Tax=Haemaphysalis longicornis TaxID=44386 RepID=A0A9J6F6L0_HAELO|nr:hypothetical protein HPB48_007276 [Haemaphysalis longicornis]
MLRNLPVALREELLDNINEIWIHGQVPASLKHAVITPILKPKKHPSDMANLPPISLKSSLCKIIERMAVTRLNYHLEEEAEHIHTCQTGFRHNLGTLNSLFLLGRILRKTNHKRPHVMVALGSPQSL